MGEKRSATRVSEKRAERKTSLGNLGEDGRTFLK
jgi:hypothetical protein